MKNIVLACSAGMSTSLLVAKMEEIASETEMEVQIWAVAQDKITQEMEKADVLLIGPQMRFLKKKLSKAASEWNVPIDVIDPIAYGRIDGEAVLNKALELLNENS
ncbi:MAG: PTS sugar transporter subunit IIB [Bacillota bacterium]|uniref:PTS sugar transporter subunit IIB n=1 Tax=Virgibacillus salarius TaxID=447199 RepID=A0A941I9W5_9BACI|nr:MULTISPECIES: PTS sugar transporter subunit IIB [Bacillaceae]NAZ08705.1 PTS sugar transporter subunit IIB [Agaribacter marinus]MBR7795993.1 PTS sugar transporter subunit IIB [Virgibacillus salarius]MCC2249950.1 PTS sugar transporter subunit IIB [Virgibacillus sp. AGTR]MDY7044139.1 PTS sugar transporter subunit IIB [Virgibacillus sp. M23]QRZ18206.1 PTS sugar transporter subunit IIB [Virgibacillus sp. AGTR]